MPKNDPPLIRSGEKVSFHPDILPNIKTEYMAEIGRIASAWALLDFHIDMAIWSAAYTNQMMGACISAQVFSTPSRLRALSALFKIHGIDKKHSEALEKFEQRTHALGQKRNRQIHDGIAVGVETGAVYRMTVAVPSDKELKFGMTLASHKEAAETLIEIIEHIKKFHSLWDDAWGEIQALRETNQLQLDALLPVRSQSTDMPKSQENPPQSPPSPGSLKSQ